MYVLIVSMLAFAFKILDLLYFLQSTKWSNFSFSAIKELFHKHGNFLQINFTWLRNFSANNEVFYRQGNFTVKKITWTKKFSLSKVFHKKHFSLIKEVSHKEIFLHSQKNSCKQISKRFSESSSFRSIQY